MKLKHSDCVKYLTTHGIKQIRSSYTPDGFAYSKVIHLTDSKPINAIFIVGRDDDAEFRNVLDLCIYRSKNADDYAGYSFKKLDLVNELVGTLNRCKSLKSIKEKLTKYNKNNYNSKL